MKSRALGVLVALAALAALRCGSSDSSSSGGKKAGSEGGPCYGNGTCNSGLVCLSQLCVVPADGASGGGTGGSAGSGGTAASGGGSGGSGGPGGSDGAAGDAALPVQGALHVTWSLETGSNPTTCSAVAGATTIDVIATPSGSTNLVEAKFACGDGTGNVMDLAFGDYTVAVSLLDASNLSLGAAPSQQVTLAATGCDSIISGECAKNLDVTVTTF